MNVTNWLEYVALCQINSLVLKKQFFLRFKYHSAQIVVLLPVARLFEGKSTRNHTTRITILVCSIQSIRCFKSQINWSLSKAAVRLCLLLIQRKLAHMFHKYLKTSRALYTENCVRSCDIIFSQIVLDLKF